MLREAGRLAVEEVPRPEPEPGELLLRVRDCGICGSDLHAAHTLPPGTVMGHEFAGEVAALGSGVSGWDVGEPVVALPYMACGSCAACVAGDGIRGRIAVGRVLREHALQDPHHTRRDVAAVLKERG